MVHVWYVEYGATVHDADPKAVYDAVLAEIKAQDPDAYIEEIRQYKYQIAFYVNHPTWKRESPVVWGAAIFLILVAIAGVLAAAGYFINAWVGWEKEHRWYHDKDPVTGESVEIYGWSAYLAWLAANKPETLAALKDYGATNWWERIIEWFPIILILIGAAIFIPIITKLIPGRE